MSKETFTYDELNVGSYEAMAVDIAEGQKIARGDLLIASGDTFAKDTAGAVAGKVYCVAAEDVDATDGVKSAIAYFSGKFNREKVTAQANKGSEYVLAGQGILLVNVR